MTKIGWRAFVNSTTLESNKSCLLEVRAVKLTLSTPKRVLLSSKPWHGNRQTWEPAA